MTHEMNGLVNIYRCMYLHTHTHTYIYIYIMKEIIEFVF
jgi:hypothetical protein